MVGIFCCGHDPGSDDDELRTDGTKAPWRRAGISKELYEEMVAEFVTLDLNGDHTLSRSEFKNLSRLPRFLGMKEEDVAHLFNTVDANHDEHISMKEFVNYMSKRKDHLPLPVQRSPQKRRLEDNMKKLGFELCTTDGGQKGVAGDGNCQFYSLSWELHKTVGNHSDIRSGIIEYLRGPGRSDFEVFYSPDHPSQPPTFDGYLQDMAQDCTWGDHLTLQAAANIFNANVRVLTADRFSDSEEKPLLTVFPQVQSSGENQPTIWLSFAAQHYSPIQPTWRTPKELLA